MEKTKKNRLILIIIAVLMPVLQASVLFLVHKIEFGTGLPSPIWTDEATYCAILKTWATDGCHDFWGNALGYYGYNGEHAIIGHGSAWNPVVLLPYLLLVKMCGYSISVIFFSNVLFLTISIMLFILLTNPNVKNLIFLIILQAVSAPIILYLSTDMTEILRFSYSILLAGLIFRLYEKEEDYVAVRYILTPLAILFMMQAYIFFVFIVPVYMWGILRKKKVWVRILGVFLGSVLSGGGSYIVLHYISSNYDTYKTDALLNALSADDFILAVKQVWWVMQAELDGRAMFLIHGSYGHGLIRWFFFAVILLFAYSLVMCIAYKLLHKRFYTYFISTFCLLIFNVAFWTLYSIESFTLFRSISIVVIFSLYLCIADKEKNDFALLIMMAIGMIYVPINEAEFSENRYLTEEAALENAALEKSLSDCLIVNSDGDAWESTVLIYTMEPRVIASMPAGAGINLMFDDRIKEPAGYLFMSKRGNSELNAAWLEQSGLEIYKNNKDLLDKEYNIVWEDNSYILYKRKR